MECNAPVMTNASTGSALLIPSSRAANLESAPKAARAASLVPVQMKALDSHACVGQLIFRPTASLPVIQSKIALPTVADMLNASMETSLQTTHLGTQALPH
jgi:hypothetical protein